MPQKLEFWALQTVAMLLTAFLIPGLTISGPIAAFVTVLVLSLVNTYLWDAALFLSIPLDFTTHTIALIVANGILFWVIVKILPGIAVKGLLPALVAPVVFTIFTILIQHYGPLIDWQLVLKKVAELFSTVRGQLQPPPPSPQSSAHSLASLVYVT
ncbi:MAG: hypothetical protein EBZ48_00855 [Proteobacteria bacterium]|nr:hypothetical protein [Pseudomonadota bacterium]